MTKNYIIIIEQPYVYSAAKVFGGVLTKNLSIKDWLSWQPKPEMRNTFFVVEKATGKLVGTEFESADPFFYLHIVNAFETGDGSILIDLMIFPDSNVLENMTVQNLREANFNEKDQPYGARFCLPMINVTEVEEGFNLNSEVKTDALAIRSGNKVILSPEILTEKGLEMPTINKKYLGKKFNYYYATGSATKGFFQSSICKIDTVEKKTTLWRDSLSNFIGEPVFVPHPKPSSEDDGVILSCISTDGSVEGEKDFLLVLDAKTFKEIGRAYINSHMSQGVHGIFIPAS